MNVDELLRQLARTDEFPRDAIEASLANWDAVSDRYLARLRALASGAELSPDDGNALFFIVHMFAEKRDTRAYAPLCRVLAEQPEAADWLSEAVIETLGNVLVSLYDGDPEPLKTVAEAPDAEPWARYQALTVLGYLTRAGGALSDDEMRAWLRAFAGRLTDVDDPLVGQAWAHTIAALGYDDLGPDVARALSKGLVDADAYDIKDFHAEIAAARADPTGLAGFDDDSLGPFGSTVEILSEFEVADAEFADEDESGEFSDSPDDFGSSASADNHQPYVNPLRDVGRNDPCPCGSGKKYKKCCLAA